MPKNLLTKPSRTVPRRSPGTKNNACAVKPQSPPSKYLNDTRQPSMSLSASLWTNKRLAGYYHSANSIVELVDLAEQRILALDGPIDGEIAWNHLSPAERKKLALAIDQIRQTL